MNEIERGRGDTNKGQERGAGASERGECGNANESERRGAREGNVNESERGKAYEQECEGERARGMRTRVQDANERE